MDFADILTLLLSYLPWSILVIIFFFLIHEWEKWEKCAQVLKNIFGELKDNRYVSKEINPQIVNSFYTCERKEPIFQAYRRIIPVQLKVSYKVNDVLFKFEKGKVVAIIPSKCWVDIVKALEKHFSDNLSQFSIVKNYKKLEKALELYCLELVIKNSGLNGALTVVVTQFLNRVKEDEEIRHLLNIMKDINDKLKQLEAPLDRRLSMILLIETYRVGFNVTGKMLM